MSGGGGGLGVLTRSTMPEDGEGAKGVITSWDEPFGPAIALSPKRCRIPCVTQLSVAMFEE